MKGSVSGRVYVTLDDATYRIEYTAEPGTPDEHGSYEIHKISCCGGMPSFELSQEEVLDWYEDEIEEAIWEHAAETWRQKER